MSRTDKTLALGIAILLLATTGGTDNRESKENPYKVILERNPFSLREFVSSEAALPTNQAIKVPINLTGITVDGTSKRAWLVIPAGSGRQQPKYLSLSEGESEGDIKVIEVNETNPTVKIINSGVPVILNFENDGFKAPVAPVSPPPVPGAALSSAAVAPVVPLPPEFDAAVMTLHQAYAAPPPELNEAVAAFKKSTSLR